MPCGTFNSSNKDMKGTNAKIVVKDENGVTGKFKLGTEAQPETATSRIV